MTKRFGISRLGCVILSYLAFSVLIAGFSFLFLTNTIPSIINTAMSTEYSQPARAQIAADLQAEIDTLGLHSGDYAALYQWSKRYTSAQMQIQRSGRLIFDSGYLPVEAVQLPQAEDFPLASNEQAFPLTFQDGQAELSIHLYVGEQSLLLIKYASMIGVSIIALFLFLFLLQRKIAYLLEISGVVQNYEGGLLSARINIEGADELSTLAENINSMAAALEAETTGQQLLYAQNARLVSSLSHDIRTPLTAIISYLDIVRTRDSTPEKRAQYLEIISDKAEQIKALTNTLFDHAIEADAVPDVALTLVDGALFVEELFEESSQLLTDEGYMVQMSGVPTPAFTLAMHYFLFRRIWDNLYSNLQKYADKRAPVFLIAEVAGGLLAIRIANTIRADAIGQVESNGIGLRNCRDIATQLGGACIYAVADGQFEVRLTFPTKNMSNL